VAQASARTTMKWVPHPSWLYREGWEPAKGGKQTDRTIGFAFHGGWPRLLISLARLARELEYSHNGTNTFRIGGIASRPCKERKDGEPGVVLLEWKPQTEGWPPAMRGSLPAHSFAKSANEWGTRISRSGDGAKPRHHTSSRNPSPVLPTKPSRSVLLFDRSGSAGGPRCCRRDPGRCAP